MTTSKTQQNIPDGWKQVALGDLVSVTTGNRDANHGSQDGQYPFFTCAQKVSKINEFSFDTEAVLIAGNGDFNVKYYSGKFDAYQRTYVLSDFKNTTGPFVYQKAKQALNDIMRNNQGSSVKFIKMGDLTDYEFILPPIKEQQKITEVLGTVDEDIAKTQEVIEATEKLKRGLMQQLFTRGLDDGISEMELGKISKVTSSKRIMRSEYVESGVPFYRSKEIIEKARGIKHDSIFYISQERFDEIEKKFGAPHIGDILITAVGTIGIVYLVDKEGFYFKDGNLLWIKDINKSLDKSYLKYYMNSEIFQKRVLGTAIGSNQKALTIEKMEKVIVPIPKLPEQRKIAEILSAVDEKISINKKLKAKLTLLKKGLMQDLLSGKVRTNHLV